MTNERQPDELDALLQRIGEDKVAQPNQPASSRHKKAFSLFSWGSNNDQDKIKRQQQRKERHRKNKSSISDLYHSIADNVNLQPIREDFQQVGKEVREQWVHELEEMDEGHVGFFDMGISRSLSVIPEDIPDFLEEFNPTKEEEGAEEVRLIDEENQEKEEPPASANVMIFNYLGLFLAVFAVSSKATGFHMLDNVDAPLKQYWKMSATSVGLFPFAVYQYRKTGMPQLSFGQWLTFLAAIVCYSVQAVLFVKALDYTTVGNACIYANSQALLLIVAKVCVGEKIHWMEGMGVLIAFGGAILCTQDAEEQSTEDTDNSTNGLIGDGLALLSAVAGVSYLTFAKAVRSGISVIVFVFAVMVIGQFFILMFLQLTSDGLEYNLNIYDGVFGWLDPHRLPILIYMVVVVNGVGTMGFVRAMEHFDTIVIAVATLMEPLLASLIAYVCNAGLLPGPLGWVGNLIVVLGTLCVVYPSIGKDKGSSMH